MNYQVNALAASASALYAGGYFTTAGTNVSGLCGQANLPVGVAIVPPTPLLVSPMDYSVSMCPVSAGFQRVIQAAQTLQNLDPLQNQFARQRITLFLRFAVPRRSTALLPESNWLP